MAVGFDRELDRLKTSRDPQERIEAANALARYAAMPRGEPESPTLGASHNAQVISGLGEALYDRDPVVQALSACGLGRFGTIQAARRLIPWLQELFPAPDDGPQTLSAKRVGPAPAGTDVRAVGVAALAAAVQPDVLAMLGENEWQSLRRRMELWQSGIVWQTTGALRVAIVEALVVLTVRAAGVAKPLLPNLTPLLDANPPFSLLAAIALLKASVEKAPLLVAAWFRRSGTAGHGDDEENLLKTWANLIVDYGGKQRATADLRPWLDTAAMLWKLENVPTPTRGDDDANTTRP
jgi:hypothetical protein